MSKRIEQMMRLAGATVKKRKINDIQDTTSEYIVQVKRPKDNCSEVNQTRHDLTLTQDVTFRQEKSVYDLPADSNGCSPRNVLNVQHVTETVEEESDIVENSSTDQALELNPCLLSRQRYSYELRDEIPGPSYVLSPIHSNESDVDLSDTDPTYIGNMSRNHITPRVIEESSSSGSSSSDSSSESSSSSSSSNSENDSSDLEHAAQSDTTKKRGRKKSRNPQNWKQNKVQKQRNSGQPYTSMSASSKSFPGRSVKPPCTQTCKQKCTEKICEETRATLFNSFWQLGDLYKQRAFLGSCMVDVQPKYRYTNAENPRSYNKAYYFNVDNKRIRVCKLFFKNTLDITDRMIQTTKNKHDGNGFLQEDFRGKHENHRKISEELVHDIREHINSIPHIESQYLKKTALREYYIDGSKTITDLYKDFQAQQAEKEKDAGKFCSYYKIFTTEFNLGFFQPKKDLCNECVKYENSSPADKDKNKQKQENHLKEKRLARIEKAIDRQDISTNKKVVVYDLQAVMQCPNGDTSAFYYKSKLNSFNFTLTDLAKKDGNMQNRPRKNKQFTAYETVDCYFWTETDGKRGANEIGSCVYDYLQNLENRTVENEIDVIFYSDNCCGQNKNKYVTTMYLYAINSLEQIRTITHKFLITGHTQNEADNVHSLIEKQIKRNRKSGPIYCPQQYIPIIKSAKKTKKPFVVHELTYNFFKNMELLQTEWGYNYNVNDKGESVVWNDIKVLKFTKEDPFVFYYKSSYEQEEYSKVNVRNKRKKMPSITEISLQTLFSEKLQLTDNKKKDLKDLISKNLIPNFYTDYYNTIL